MTAQDHAGMMLELTASCRGLYTNFIGREYSGFMFMFTSCPGMPRDLHHDSTTERELWESQCRVW